uniref:Uncharacterized protein n=1 Tax=Panagrolaimus sp. JU765 TaxID=591449 RepID=A0AC34R1G6_9BILA
MENQVKQILNSENNAAKDEKLLKLVEEIQKNLVDGIEKLQKNQRNISLSLDTTVCQLIDNETLIKIQENEQLLPQIVLDEEEESDVQNQENEVKVMPSLAEYVFDSVKSGLSCISRKKIPIEMHSDVDNSVCRIFEDVNPYLVRDLPPLIGSDEFHTGGYGKLTKTNLNQDLKDVVIELPRIPIIAKENEGKNDSAMITNEMKSVEDQIVPENPKRDVAPLEPSPSAVSDDISVIIPDVETKTIQQQLNQEIQNAMHSLKLNLRSPRASPSIKSTTSSESTEDILRKPTVVVKTIQNSNSSIDGFLPDQPSQILENSSLSKGEEVLVPSIIPERPPSPINIIPPLPTKPRIVEAPKVLPRTAEPINDGSFSPSLPNLIEKPKAPERKAPQVAVINEDKPSNNVIRPVVKPLPATRSKLSSQTSALLSPNKNPKAKSLFSSSDEGEDDNDESSRNQKLATKNVQISVNNVIPKTSPMPSPVSAETNRIQSLFLDDDLENPEPILKVPSRNPPSQVQTTKSSLFDGESIVSKSNERNSPNTTAKISRKLFDDSDSDGEDEFFVSSKVSPSPKRQGPQKPEDIKSNNAKNVQKPVNSNVRKSMFSSSDSD